METAVVSGRVPARLKARVDERIRRRGWSPSDVVVGAYEYLDRHGEAPWMEERQRRESPEELMAEYEALIARMPKDTPLAAMTIDDYKRELENRDV